MLKELKLKDYATFLGTLCGLFAIILAIGPGLHAYRGATLMIIIGIGADLLDGFIARKTNTFNALGKELDSLSDSLAFGIAPAIVAFKSYTDEMTDMGIPGLPWWIMFFAGFLFILGAITRLAYFNISENEGYEGLPTPLSASAVALLILADYFAFAVNNFPIWFNYLIHYSIPIWLVFFGWLNVTGKVAYGKSIRKKSGKLKYVFLTLAIIIIVLFIIDFIDRSAGAPFMFIAFLILLGTLFSFIFLGFRSKRK